MSQSVCPARFNCQSADAWEPNSDIAGLGVLIGFVGTGYLVFALLVIHYLVAYEPELPPPRQTPDDERPSQAASLEHVRANPSDVSAANIVTRTETMYWEPNPIDVNLLAWVRSWIAKLLVFLGASLPLVGQTTSEHISRCFNKCIIAMCDVQIVTGMSILIGGFMCLDENLSALHWQIITYLACFSCVTHLSGLTVLRRYFQTHPREKSLRITLMFVLLVILVIAIVPSGFFNWTSPRADASQPQPTAASAKTSAACFYSLNCAKQLYQDSLTLNCTEICSDDSNSSVHCHLHPNRDSIGFSCRWLAGSSAMQEMIISTVLLFFGFVSRTIKLSPRVSSAMHRRLILPVSNHIVYCLIKLEDLVPAPETRLRTGWDVRTLSRKAWQTLVVRPVLAATMLVSTHVNLFNSMLGELSWLLAILLWGTSKVMSAHYDEKYYADEYQKQHQDEEHSPKWEFGQVLPVLLLAAPLVAVIGTFASLDNSGEANHSNRFLESTGFGTIGDGSPGRQQSDENSWELASLSAPETNLTAQRQDGNVLSRAETDNTESTIAQNQRISGRNVFAKDRYSKTLWISTYITFGFVTIWAHVFFLFWFATDAFLVPELYTLRKTGKLTNSLDYLFARSNGIFYLVLASYPVACHSTILFGLAIDQWTNARLGVPRNSSRKPFFWLWTLGVYSIYAIYTYLGFGVIKGSSNHDSDNAGRLVFLGHISAGLYALYLLGCLVHMATTWKNLGASESP